MFPQMRRKKQEISFEKCVDILNRATSGVLAVIGEGGYPYTVPISYVYTDGKIIFHSAKNGHKIDAIKKDDKVSFCVIDKNDIKPAEFTTYFRSVIAFGRIRILETDEEKRDCIEKLAIRYSPKESVESRNKEIESTWKALCMLEMEIEHMTGKEAIELVNKKQG